MKRVKSILAAFAITILMGGLYQCSEVADPAEEIFIMSDGDNGTPLPPPTGG